MDTKPPLRHLFGGALLVCGTSVGAGMLALPVSTALGGFFPSIVIYLFCYLFMTATGLLLMEIALKMPKDANIISMASHYLGTFGKIVCWVLYIFLFYLLSVAYISGGSELIRAALSNKISLDTSAILFVIALSPFVIAGAKFVDRINFFFMFGLIGTFFLFLYLGKDAVQVERLSVINFPKAFIALPIIFTSFSYQGVIPTLTYYLKKDAKTLRYAIVLGNTLTLVIYLIWEFFVLGIVPLEGANGLINANLHGIPAIEPLRVAMNMDMVTVVCRSFGFFAIITSFLGVTLGVFDFLADGFKVQKTGKNKVLLACLTFIPPLLIAIYNPGMFLIALGYAGGVGCALLLGMIPVVMVWVKRYHLHEKEVLPQLFGGKSILIILILMVLFELSIQFFKSIYL